PRQIHALSLHDALPISRPAGGARAPRRALGRAAARARPGAGHTPGAPGLRGDTALSPAGRMAPGGADRARRGADISRPRPGAGRSEEHTSELQSRENLV